MFENEFEENVALVSATVRVEREEHSRSPVCHFAFDSHALLATHDV